MAQLYPPDNGQGPARFKRWYVDDVTGAMIPEDRAARDDEGRLREVDDMDAPGRDDIDLTPPDERLDTEEALE